LPLLLDTTVLIDALRGLPAAARVKALRESGEARPLVCAINIEEIWRGARPAEADGIRLLVRGFQLVPLGEAEAERAGRWRREFAARGVTLSQADCLIASATISAGARLATGNIDHFPMPELEVEHWPSGA
jgi:predicted nucleic acid-binding protein